MASYLLIIGDRKALGWILTASRMAFPSVGRPEVRSLAVGDELFIYTTRRAFTNRRDGGRIIGTAQVTNQVCQLQEIIRFAGREYPIGCNLEIGPLAPFGQGVELSLLVPQLDAFAGAGGAWYLRLRKPLLQLTTNDATLLQQALNAVRRDDDIHKNGVAAYTRGFVD